MNDTYNKNVYLTVSDLNDIESTIESITNQIKQNIFNNTSSSLRNIQVGDNLNSKKLYLSFPRNLYESMSSGENTFVTTNNNGYIKSTKETSGSKRSFIDTISTDDTYRIYLKYNTNISTSINSINSTLAYNFGTVTSINSSNQAYQYVKIYENEDVIPNYVKHVWQNNEVLSMQKINNIEQGIRNIGRYYYTPIGWINIKERLKQFGTNSNNISYRDLNKWKTNLSLINFDNINTLNIWNSNIIQLDWNKYSSEEWEDL